MGPFASVLTPGTVGAGGSGCCVHFLTFCNSCNRCCLFRRTAVTFAVVIGKDCSGQSFKSCLGKCGQVARFESQNLVISLACLARRARSFVAQTRSNPDLSRMKVRSLLESLELPRWAPWHFLQENKPQACGMGGLSGAENANWWPSPSLVFLPKLFLSSAFDTPNLRKQLYLLSLFVDGFRVFHVEQEFR